MINRPFKFLEPKKPSAMQSFIGWVVWIGFWVVFVELVIRAL